MSELKCECNEQGCKTCYHRNRYRSQLSVMAQLREPKPKGAKPGTSNRGFWIDPAGRECSKCGEYQLWEEFYLTPKRFKSEEHLPFGSKCRRCTSGLSLKQVIVTIRDGYKYLRINGKSVRAHRHIMEILLGRKLEKWENVHHKNGLRGDNEISNLELWCKPQLQGIRVDDLIAWACEKYPKLIREKLGE